jgi:hypothetical protein
MTLLSPAATYHAELRQQLDSVRRAISVQRGLIWLSRGLAAGLVIVLGVVVWAWTRDGVRALPIPLLIAVPIIGALLAATGSFVVRHNARDLARRVDHAARLQERSMTALELGARGEEFPLAIAQMRDAVEHLKRVDLLEVFPLRAPRIELLTAFFVSLIAVIVGFSPNPWLLQARASNPSITIAREQAQRVERLADSLQPNDNAEIDALRQLISKGAKTMDARSNEPDAALNALQDLEEQVQEMSAGDDQLTAALAAMASALASNQTTQALSDAINTGDMHQISQASKDLAQSMAGLSSQDRAQVAQTLRDASQRAGRISQSVASQLSTAAEALDQAAAAANGADGSQDSSADGQQSSTGQGAQAASDAMNQLSQSAAAADARQRAASQLESSRNALERALGRTQSRSGSNSSSSNSSNNRSASNGQGQGADSGSADAQDGSGSAQNQSGDQGSNGQMNGSGSQNDAGGQGSDTGQGGGYSTSGDPSGANNNGSPSQLDAIVDPQQVPTNGNVSPDESSVNPYTSAAGSGDAQTAPESVQPSYSNKPTQGNDQGSIPLGLRDLVKDYFSSLDQK